jgi:hypothetical protein
MTSGAVRRADVRPNRHVDVGHRADRSDGYKLSINLAEDGRVNGTIRREEDRALLRQHSGRDTPQPEGSGAAEQRGTGPRAVEGLLRQWLGSMHGPMQHQSTHFKQVRHGAEPRRLKAIALLLDCHVKRVVLHTGTANIVVANKIAALRAQERSDGLV